MLSESTPMLSHAIPAFEKFMKGWEEFRGCVPWCMPYIEVGLRWAREYYDRMGHSRAYSVVMCKLAYHVDLSMLIFVYVLLCLWGAVVDPCVALMWVEKYWDPELVRNVKNDIKSLVSLCNV
jgi:hypothetical protein